MTHDTDILNALSLMNRLSRSTVLLTLYAAEEEHWVTIGSDKSAPPGEKGGTPVLIGKGGEIEKGPKALQGKTPEQLRRHPMYDRRTGALFPPKPSSETREPQRVQRPGAINLTPEAKPPDEGSGIAEAHERAMTLSKGADKEKTIDPNDLPEHQQGETVLPSIENPHTMTADEYHQARKARAMAEGKPVQAAVFGREHEEQVAQALNRGEEVPEHVMEEYPHLLGTAVVEQHRREQKEKRLRAEEEQQKQGQQEAMRAMAGLPTKQEEQPQRAPKGWGGQEIWEQARHPVLGGEGSSTREPPMTEQELADAMDPPESRPTRPQSVEGKAFTRDETHAANSRPQAEPEVSTDEQPGQPTEPVEQAVPGPGSAVGAVQPEPEAAGGAEPGREDVAGGSPRKPRRGKVPGETASEPVQSGDEPATPADSGRPANQNRGGLRQRRTDEKAGEGTGEAGQHPDARKQSAIERALLNHLSETGGGYTVEDEQALNEAAGAGDPFLFHGKLPTEIKEFMQGRPELRRLFRVTNDPTKSGGADAFGALGDRYLDIAERKAGGGIRQALEAARNSPDPEIKLLAAIYETRQPKGPKQEAVPASELQPGEKAEINGIPVEVTEDEEGERVLKDSGDLPDTPVDALDGLKLPVDKGTRGKAPEPQVPDDPFADIMEEPSEEELRPNAEVSDAPQKPAESPAEAQQEQPPTAASPQRSPADVDVSRQLGMFAKDKSGNPVEVGEHAGQANLFNPSKYRTAEPAKEPEPEFKNFRPEGTAEMFPEKKEQQPEAPAAPTAKPATITVAGRKFAISFNPDGSNRVENQGGAEVLTYIHNGMKEAQITTPDGKRHYIGFHPQNSAPFDPDREKRIARGEAQSKQLRQRVKAIIKKSDEAGQPMSHAQAVRQAKSELQFSVDSLSSSTAALRRTLVLAELLV